MPRPRAIARQINDDFDQWTDAYVDWIEECINVQEAYESWCSSGTGEDADLAFLVYRAALDREEQASILIAELAP
ncbi:MAG TPA: hypothetical protein VK501_10270 [Baekduia sp.]|uniref:hypothetical protein n=1 Tax=Baekduia sp. TaxID=2600305 RepID=UPI002BB0D27D|nr:hypothetical protein [Baekduia sp.]HMJ34294.1 hypothetical protein [Baekduia sp.]